MLRLLSCFSLRNTYFLVSSVKPSSSVFLPSPLSVASLITCLVSSNPTQSTSSLSNTVVHFPPHVDISTPVSSSLSLTALWYSLLTSLSFSSLFYLLFSFRKRAQSDITMVIRLWIAKEGRERM
ncbi:hypothetical protein GDO81_009893 [Engystomops pustulosus]|uniref:Uncharacterized protein n=1 Tax=Engystomops pustulosus TaxID=76066 RepID=A0AAV7BVY0_ENGPU|nr:hypothetical protein GDO81_009893 [Engystomops pustulosus]